MVGSSTCQVRRKIIDKKVRQIKTKAENGKRMHMAQVQGSDRAHKCGVDGDPSPC